MKRVGIIFLAVLILLTVFSLLFFKYSGKKEEIDLSAVHFEEGDIAFRRGIGTKSSVVSHVDKKGIYSHVGIVVKQDSVFMVIHITPGERENGETEDKIKMELPEQFFSLKKAQFGALIRLKDSLEYGANAAQKALQLLQEGILFDHDYSLENSDKMYCTELIWQTYLSAGKDVTQGRRSSVENMPLYSGTYIFPSDIFDNDEFTLIYKF